MSVTRDLIVESISAHYSRRTSKTVTGYVRLQNAGTINLVNPNADFVASDTSMYALMSGMFGISNDDVLTEIYFSTSISVTYFVTTSASRTITFEFQVSGSRPLSVGTYVVVVRSDYSVSGVNVVAP